MDTQEFEVLHLLASGSTVVIEAEWRAGKRHAQLRLLLSVGLRG
jgi:hypothetical protein